LLRQQRDFKQRDFIQCRAASLRYV